MTQLPNELLELIVNYADFVSQIQIAVVFGQQTYSLIKWINIDSKKKKQTNILEQMKNIAITKNVCDQIARCHNAKAIVVKNLYCVNNDICLHSLLGTLNGLPKLRGITLAMPYSIKSNSCVLMNGLLINPNLNKLRVLRIPNIVCDNFSSYSEIRDVLKYLSQELQSIEVFDLKLKHRIHHAYLDNINHITLKVLHISSNNFNIFNNQYTIFNAINQNFVVRRHVSFPNLRELNCKMHVNEVKALLFVMDDPTKKSIRKMVVDFDGRFYRTKHEIYRMLARVNDAKNLETLVIRGMSCFIEKSTTSVDKIQMDFRLKHLDISEFSDKRDIKNIGSDITGAILKNMANIVTLETLVINLRRYRLKYTLLRNFEERIKTFAAGAACPGLVVIRDCDLFQYLYVILNELFQKIKMVVILNVSKSHGGKMMLYKPTYVKNFSKIVTKFHKAGKTIYFHTTANLCSSADHPDIHALASKQKIAIDSIRAKIA